MEKPEGLVLGAVSRDNAVIGEGAVFELIKPSLAPSVLMEWLLGWEMSLICACASRAEPCCSLAPLSPQKPLLSLTTTIHERGTGTMLLVFTGPFPKRYCISLSHFALKCVLHQPGMEPFPMDASTKHMLALGVAAKSLL